MLNIGELYLLRVNSPIMKTERFHARDMARLLKKQKIATLPELKRALGTEVDSTLFRKLETLDYLSSYSHRGRYYALGETARFDQLGLWSFRSVWFSKHGTLLATLEALVQASEAGYTANELENIVNVSVKAPLLKLVREQRLVRDSLFDRFVYVASEASTRRDQLASRQVYQAEPSLLGLGVGVRVLPEELKAAIVLFYSLLDEKQRRLYAGLESLKIGHGGDQQISELLGLNPSTIARGRRDLLARDAEIGRVRRPGAGRKSVQKKRPTSSERSKS